MSIPTQDCPVTLQPWQGYYNGWLFGSGTPYSILEVSKGFDMVAIGSQDAQYPRQTGEIIGLDVAKGRDLNLHFWVAPVGQNPAPGGLMKIMEQAVSVGGFVEEPLWLYIPPWPILAFMVRARKRSFPLDVNFSTAGLIKPSLSFHATDPIGYANLKTADLTAPTANLLTGEDATFVGGIGSWTGTNVTLSNTTAQTLGNSSSLEIVPVTNGDPASISTAQGTSSAYQVSGLAGQEITVMASVRAAGPPATLPAPTVTPEGTTGSTAYDYSFSASILGTIEASSAGSTTTGNATLDSTNYNLVAWAAVPLPAGSSGNLVYDSNLEQALATAGPTWNNYNLSTVTVSGAGTSSGAFVIQGTGSTSGRITMVSQGFEVNVGTPYIVSASVNATNATAGAEVGVLFSPSSTYYQETVLQDSPTLYWPLTDQPGSTTVADASGSGNTGTIEGGVTLGAPGPIAQFPEQTSGLFNGSTGYIQTSYPGPSTTAITVETWVRLDGTLSAYPALVSNNHTTNTSIGFELYLYENSVYIVFGSGYPYSASGGSITDTNWHHIVAVLTGTEIYLYLDGVQVGTGTYAGTYDAGTTGIEAGRGTYGGDYVPGEFAQVAVYPSALSPSRVLAHYNAAFPVLASAQASANSSGVVSAGFTPSGSGFYSAFVSSNGATVTSGDTLTFSQIQATQSSTVQAYQAGPLWTYEVYRNNAPIGSTSALAFEDTGQTPGPAGGTSAFQLGVEFYDLAGNSLSNVQSPVFSDSQGFWSFVSFGTDVPSTAATLAVNVTTDALNGTHYLSDVGVFAVTPSANLAPDTSILNTWTLSSGFGIAASALGGNEITFDGSGSSSSSSQALYLEAQTEYVISSYLDASNATAGSISMEIAGYSAVQNFGNTGTVSATFTATNTGMYQIVYNTSSLTVGSGLAVSFAQPQVEVGTTPSTYTPGQNWFLGAGTGGLTYPVTYPVVYQTQSKKFVAQNNGNWPVYPRVTMTGPLNLPTLTVGSQSFALDNNQNPTIPEGYQVAIDMQTHAVIYSAVGQTEGTNYLSWVTNSSEWLTIPVGGAEVEFASGAQDTGSCIFESADGWFM